MSDHVIECLRAENAALREQLSTMTQAVGLASTIKGEMLMRPDDPIGMMQEIVAAVAALRAQLAERDAEIAALKAHAEAMADEAKELNYKFMSANEHKIERATIRDYEWERFWVAVNAYRAAYPKEADK